MTWWIRNMVCEPFSHDWEVEEISSLKEELTVADFHIVFRCKKCAAKIQGMIEP
tara:strand:- start:148 stop:309 length:162 start_codon:yes stop_codon:yes gene_type:complete